MLIETVGNSLLNYVARASHDVDEHATHISSWSQEYDQLSCGRFEGTVREVWINAIRMQVFHEQTGQQTSQRCHPWTGSIWFGVPDGISTKPLHFCGRRHSMDHDRVMLSARADDSFVLSTPQNFGIYGVVVDEAWLNDQLQRLGIHKRSDGLQLQRSIQSSAMPMHQHLALCHTIESILMLGAAQGQGESDAAALNDLVERLLRLLVASREIDGSDVESQLQIRRVAGFITARNLVTNPINQAMTIEDLCTKLHLTPRTLQNHFCSIVGESPAQFLRVMRLNSCRRQLRATPRTTTVQNIAEQWGFFHMGHFSQSYKAMFGELPSQTKRLVEH